MGRGRKRNRCEEHWLKNKKNVPEIRINEAGEIVIKTMSDYWIVGKVSNLREFYVVIQQKNASIIEIDDEVKRLCEQQLRSIFFD